MTTLLAQYSENNIVNSIASVLASNLLSANYLVYWQARDGVQTPDGFYYGWSTNYATYMADGTFLARITAAKGMVTLVEHIPASPTWILRPITTAGPIGQDQLVLPVLSVEVGPMLNVKNYELGSAKSWRSRHLVIDGYVRDQSEQKTFMDLLSIWFDNETFFSVQDHDAGTLATVGDIETDKTQVDYAIQPIAVEPVTFQVICNSRLQYIA